MPHGYRLPEQVPTADREPERIADRRPGADRRRDPTDRRQYQTAGTGADREQAADLPNNPAATDTAGAPDIYRAAWIPPERIQCP